LHEALAPIAWLEGTWRTESHGSGKYPTIKDFSYYEVISFTSLGQPMFNYTAQSFTDSDLKKPMHRETGFLKVTPGTNEVFFILAHNFGLTTIERGEIIGKTINLCSDDIVRLKGTKTPHVTQTRRSYVLCDNSLEFTLYMGTSNTPSPTEHLHAKYVKVRE